MSFGDILTKYNVMDAPVIPYLNTGTGLDILSGNFLPGANGEFILNGGLGASNGYIGRHKQFKTTTALSQVVNVLSRYPDSYSLVFDAEQSTVNKSRILNMSDLYLDEADKRLALIDSLDKRMIVTNISQYDLEAFFEMIKKVAEDKIKNIKDYIVETPFLNLKTHKLDRMIIPTIMVVDTWSMARITSAMETLQGTTASDSGTNTVFMKEGIGKNKILIQLPNLCVKAGIYFVATVHVGDGIEMNSMMPPSKTMQYMKQGDRLKSAGSDFLKLISNLYELRSAKVLQDGDKECLYPYSDGITSDQEMSTTTMVVLSGKNNNSGAQFNPVLSQKNGYENRLTNYNTLRENDYFGLGTNKVHTRPTLLPEVTFTRKTVSEKLKDYKIGRAVEILSQLCFIQSYWTTSGSFIPFDITPEHLADCLFKSSYAMDDILNSRGWWTYQKDHPRHYLSIWDVLGIASGHYKPKFLSAKAV